MSIYELCDPVVLMAVATRCVRRIQPLFQRLRSTDIRAIETLLEQGEAIIRGKRQRREFYIDQAFLVNVEPASIEAYILLTAISLDKTIGDSANLDYYEESGRRALGSGRPFSGYGFTLSVHNAVSEMRSHVTAVIESHIAAVMLDAMNDPDAAEAGKKGRLLAQKAVEADLNTIAALHPKEIVDPSETGPLGRYWADEPPRFNLTSPNAYKYYSCFISYSSKDEEFARKLHQDLKKAGISCWYAPKDLKIGVKIRVEIDRTIALYDKLLVILSGNSVSSQWVEKEVGAAFEKERDRNTLALFPIRLDDAVMEIKEGWPADIRRDRNIGDFREWKDEEHYSQSLKRLFDDLKKEGVLGLLN